MGLSRRLLNAGLLLGSLAAPPAAGQAHYLFRLYGTDAGLAKPHALALDASGTLFVGTNDGLQRFDGRAFEALPLPGDPNPLVLHVAAAPDGAVWALTDAPALFRRSADGRTEAVPLPAVLDEALDSPPWWLHLRPDGRGGLCLNVPVGTLSCYDGRRWHATALPPGHDRLTDFFLRRDTLWMATRAALGFAPVRDGRFGPFHRLAAAKRPVALRPHPRGAWVVSVDGVRLLDRDGSLRAVLGPEYEGSWLSARPSTDAAGRLLVTLQREKVPVVLGLEPDGRVAFSSGTQLSERIPTDLAHDPESGFWGVTGDGLVRLEQTALTYVPLVAPDGVGERAYAVVPGPRADRLWVSTWGGLFVVEHGRARRVSTARRAASPVSFDTDGAVWWGEGPSLWFRLGAEGPPAPASAPFPAFTAPDGRRLVFHPEGLFLERGGRRTRFTEEPAVGAVAVASGRLWFSPDGQTLTTVEGDSLGSTCRACLSPDLRAVQAAFTEGPVYALESDAAGRLWVAQGLGGLACVWPDTEGRWHVRRFTEADGLLTDKANALEATPDGRLWVGTARGLQGFRLAPGVPALPPPFLELRAQDGLEGDDLGALFEDERGALWFATTPGRLHRLDWRRWPRLPSPALRVAGVERDGEGVAPGPQRLRAGESRLAVRLLPATYRMPERVRLEYRVAGLDSAWTSLGQERTVRLAYLPAGRYTLEARAVRPGAAPGPVATLPLTVSMPFYRALWFYALVALVLAGAGAWAYRARQERRLAVERLRLRIAADLHDDLGTGLTQVSLLSELARRKALGAAPEAAAWSEKIGEEARDLAERMRDVVWAIRPDEDAWTSLEMRMKDAGAALLDPRGIRLLIEGEAEAAPPLSAEVRRNVLLAFKEALHNAVRHGAPSQVEVTWRLGRERLWLRVRDDGQGFDPATVRGGGNGLRNLRERARALGGEAVIKSAPGAGTSVTFAVPLRPPGLLALLRSRAQSDALPPLLTSGDGYTGAPGVSGAAYPKRLPEENYPDG